MKIESFDYISGDSLGDISLNSLNFGDIIQNQHCVKPLVIRLSDSTSIVSNVKLFLEDKGLWKDTDYGYFVAPDFTSNIQPGSDLFNHFVEVPGATSISSDGIDITWHQDQSHSDFIWLDADMKQKNGTISANYRFFYDI